MPPGGADLALAGPVLTLDPARPVAPGVVVRNGRIVSFSVVDGARRLPAGAVAVPGFHDPHLHLLAMAAARRSVDLSGAVSLAQVGERLRSAPGGGWVRAWGLDEYDVAERRLPTLEELDAWVPHRPLVVHHRTGHHRLVNTVASVAGVAPPPLPFDELAAAVREVDAELAEAGVVAVTDATHTNDRAALELLASLRFTVRVTAMVGADRLAGLAAGSVVGGRVRVGPAKVMPPAVGLDAVPELMRAARAAGFVAAVHAVDVDEVEAALAGAVAGDRFEHAGLVLPEQVERMAAIGVRVVTQPAFVTRRAAKYSTELSEVEIGWLYRIRSLLEAGIEVRASSDAPVVPARPLEAVFAASIRRDLAPSERIDVESALSLNARTLTLGGRGDVVVLSADPRVAPPDEVHVVATVRDGAVVFGQC